MVVLLTDLVPNMGLGLLLGVMRLKLPLLTDLVPKIGLGLVSLPPGVKGVCNG